MEIKVPELSLVLLIGTSGSGKSSFAKKQFLPYETVSSDTCRGMVTNDENKLDANEDTFELLEFLVAKRLKRGLLTVIDATNVQPQSRQKLVRLAREYHVLPVAIVLNIPQRVCEDRNANRTDRNMGKHVIRNQALSLKKSLRFLKKEGFRKIYVLKSEEEVNAVTGIVREKLYNDKKEEHGPFDIVGDVHGCFDELKELLMKLNYRVNIVEEKEGNFGFEVIPPENRKVIFLGDLVDRGPKSPEVLRLVMSMVDKGVAICVPGNHDLKLQKWLNGKQVNTNHGLQETIEQLEKESEAFKNKVKEFLYSLISHYVVDDGKLVVAHAGLREDMQGRGSGAVRAFCLYGETTGEIDEFGLPVRYNWAAEYRGRAKVIYGHTPVPKAVWLNKTINIDTGCVFGGKLTAFRYPEEELVEVAAKEIYCEPVRPLQVDNNTDALSHQQAYDDLLNIEDVIGKRIIQTRLRNNLTIKEENSIAALEVMSRFALNPKWLIYLPPTMSPCETSPLDGFLEHPLEAIDYYKKRGIRKVVCEEKHMGSRAVIVLAKDEAAALERFGIQGEGIGKCYTRTGRNFFKKEALEREFLSLVKSALDKSGFWEKFKTEWVCLDCELMPWSAKAQALLQQQYAAVGAAARNALPEVVKVLQQFRDRNVGDVATVLQKFEYRANAIGKFTKAYQHYCWSVESVDDFRLAPFHIMATEGAVHADKSNVWHMENIGEIAEQGSPLFFKTPFLVVDTEEESSIQAAVDWWLELTEKGGEGMVVKPFDFISYGNKGLVQPAVKCRGSEYLRIIYGPEYDMPEHLERLKKRGLSTKRSLAMREFALGIEALERFVRKEPLRRIHESVFGVLALESEAVDPRL